QVVDAAIYESVLAFMESLIPEYALAGHIRARTGAILPKVAPSGVYRCSDGEVVIGANQDSVFRRLAAMCEADWADDPRYATHDARGERQAELDDMISAWTGARAMAEVLSAAETHGVPSGPVNTAKDLLEDAQVKARNAIVRVADPVLGDVPMQAVAPHLSATPGRIHRTGPAFGEHTREVFGALGMLDEDLDALQAQGVI
ncbi:MAG: CoA transferase, partial [Pseudomonadota bacterium]